MARNPIPMMTHKFASYKEASEKLTLKQKVGQLFMPAVFINDSEEEVQQIEDLIRTHAIGAICFFHSRASAATNFEGKKKVVHNEHSYDRLKQLISRYQNAAQFPLLVAIDAEWGLAMRIENTYQYPYAITLGAIQENSELIFEVGRQIALDCKKAGIHWNLAPVVDINDNPENPVIGYRSFGDDKNKVLSKSEAYLKGMKSVGVLNAIKHFPGHGDTATDSHLGLPVITKSKEDLLDNELYPFAELIKQGVDAVMVGHLAVPALDDSENPATTSSKIITNVLRKDLGFEGVIISDALNMHAVSKKFPEKGTLESTAFKAGMDVMCFSENVEEGIQQIIDSACKERIDASFKRVWKLKEHAYTDADQQQSTSPLSALNKTLAQQSITELYRDSLAVEQIKKSNFLNLSVDNQKENNFSVSVEKQYGQRHHPLELNSINKIRKLTAEYENIVLALFPPLVKPKNQFGFQSEILDFINELSAQKNVLTYLFGNPYVLDILELNPPSNVVVAFQDFPEFQTEAIHHFNGQIEAKGKLPVKLKNYHEKV
ncbi:glycoside hydrolase family 3 protein [Flagellimonas sp. S3867]|uniref:glycoside hydrolase family 3 protein n=1 Tax=Flagellimonas sp. S3867 TaxID=2768063 RepID=UPI001CC25AAF|nr:glycoside hydrolase family 3 protein [Flagellimonas sp. S3867]